MNVMVEHVNDDLMKLALLCHLTKMYLDDYLMTVHVDVDLMTVTVFGHLMITRFSESDTDTHG